MRVDLLTLLAEKLEREEIPDFSMKNWEQCALGQAVKIPEIAATGISISNGSVFFNDIMSYGFDTAAKVFGISVDQAHNIFCSVNPPSQKDVALMIRHVIATEELV